MRADMGFLAKSFPLRSFVESVTPLADHILETGTIGRDSPAFLLAHTQFQEVGMCSRSVLPLVYMCLLLGPIIIKPTCFCHTR